MIKISRSTCPVQLTPEIQRTKTEQFKKNPKKHVWKEKYICDSLMDMSHKKCAYCEVRLGEESKYMEVEHFHDKKDYPEEVVLWNNLLPSCKSCNTKKGTWDTIKHPIVNPTIDNPQDYLVLTKNFRYKSKSDPIGDDTIKHLGLNDIEQKVKPRTKICIHLQNVIKGRLEDFTYAQENKIDYILTKTANNLEELLEMCQEDEPYTAFKSNVILHSPDFDKLKKGMQSIGIWNEKHEELYRKLQEHLYTLVDY